MIVPAALKHRRTSPGTPGVDAVGAVAEEGAVSAAIFRQLRRPPVLRETADELIEVASTVEAVKFAP